MKLCDKIRIIRKARGYSQEELGYKLEKSNINGISRQSISDWENGKSEPKLDNIRDLASVLDVSFDTLLDNSIDLNDPKQLTLALYRVESIDTPIAQDNVVEIGSKKTNSEKEKEIEQNQKQDSKKSSLSKSEIFKNLTEVIKDENIYEFAVLNPITKYIIKLILSLILLYFCTIPFLILYLSMIATQNPIFLVLGMIFSIFSFYILIDCTIKGINRIKKKKIKSGGRFSKDFLHIKQSYYMPKSITISMKDVLEVITDTYDKNSGDIIIKLKNGNIIMIFSVVGYKRVAQKITELIDLANRNQKILDKLLDI